MRELPTLGVEEGRIVAAGPKRIVLVNRQQLLERDEGVLPERLRASREVAAYLVSQAFGWNIVPRTWLRDGPLVP